MGTIASISLAPHDPALLPGMREAVAGRWEELEAALSIFRESSDIARLNAAAGGSPVSIGPDARRVLAEALRIAGESGGAFDPTVGPLMAVWGFRGGEPAVSEPDAAALSAARSLVGWTNVTLSAEGAALARPGMRLDLGGIAKGFAADEAWERLRACGASSFLVDLGGNIRVSGAPAPGRATWRVGIRNPFQDPAAPGDPIIGTIDLRDGEAVATSGDYERFVVIDGVRHAHVMDARTGRPAHGVASVTVRAPSAMEADALSTALFVLGPGEGRKLLALHPGCEALWIPDSASAAPVATPGFGLVPARAMSPD